MKTLFLDIETTGLNAYTDEILSIAIVDSNGSVLLDTYVKPIHKKSWDFAQRINGISTAMVEDKPTYNELLPQLKELFKDAYLVAYNAEFDLSFLSEAIQEIKDYDCAMLAFGYTFGFERWQKLSFAVNFLDYQKPPNTSYHTSLADTLACKYIWEFVKDKKKVQVIYDKIEEESTNRLIERFADSLHFKITQSRKVKVYTTLQDFITSKYAIEFDSKNSFWITWSEGNAYYSEFELDYIDTINYLFLNERTKVVEVKQKYPTLPIYRTKKEILKELANQTTLRKANRLVYIYDSFFDKPHAIYISTSQKQIHLLYSVKKFKKEHKESGLYFTSSSERKSFGLKTITEIRKDKESVSDYIQAGRQVGQYGDYCFVYKKKATK